MVINKFLTKTREFHIWKHFIVLIYTYFGKIIIINKK